MKKGFSVLPLTWYLLMLTSASVILARVYLNKRAAIRQAEVMELQVHQLHKTKQVRPY